MQRRGFCRFRQAVKAAEQAFHAEDAGARDADTDLVGGASQHNACRGGGRKAADRRCKQQLPLLVLRHVSSTSTC